MSDENGETTCIKAAQRIASSPNKRKHGEDQTSDNAEDSSKKPRGKRCASRNNAFAGSRPFACPYYKKDPLQHRVCSNFEDRAIGHLKQHIYRKHQKAACCPMCGTTFDDTVSCNDHIRERTCQVSACVVEPDGYTPEQRDALSHRVSSKLTREQQWFCVFDIVCPGHQPRPISPFHEPDMCESTLARVRKYGPPIIIASLRQEVQWPPGMDFSVLEPLLGRALSHTFDQFATNGPESGGLERSGKGKASDCPSKTDSLRMSASCSDRSRSAEADDDFMSQVPRQPPAAATSEPDDKIADDILATERAVVGAHGNGSAHLHIPDNSAVSMASFVGAQQGVVEDIDFFEQSFDSFPFEFGWGAEHGLGS